MLLPRQRPARHPASKTLEKRRASAFIQNIHHFRDDALTSALAPDEKVVIFDEAQRAWDVAQTSKFMQQKKGQVGFSMSEPEFLLSVMDRHPDWCAIVCLVGGGQEINTGEAGIDEWLRALKRSFPHWEAHIPEALKTSHRTSWSGPCSIASLGDVNSVISRRESCRILSGTLSMATRPQLNVSMRNFETIRF